MRLSRRATPYLLLAPGLAWLAVFFLVPMYYLANTSLQTGSLEVGYTFNWAWHNYKDALTLYDEQFLRSIRYAGFATLIARPSATRWRTGSRSAPAAGGTSS